MFWLSGSDRAWWRLSWCAPADNPCRQAYADYTGGPGRTRFSWDLITTLAAVRGPSGAGCAECTGCDGFNFVNSTTGANHWVYGHRSNLTYLVMQDAQMAADTIDDLLCQYPKAARLLMPR